MSTVSDESLAPGLRIDRNVDHHDGVVGLIASGEIDMAVADQFRCALMTALHLPGVIEVVLDLGPLRFLDYYFRVYMMFETASTTYGWLNRAMAIGSAMRLQDTVIYDAYLIR